MSHAGSRKRRSIFYALVMVSILKLSNSPDALYWGFLFLVPVNWHAFFENVIGKALKSIISANGTMQTDKPYGYTG